MKVRSDGAVAIVHVPNRLVDQVQYVGLANNNYFDLHWQQDDDYPVVGDNCDNVYEVLSEGVCLCNTGVIKTSFFSKMPSSISKAVDQLHICAVDHETFDSDT